MTEIRFEWDPAKNLANQRKHGVSFEAASQVFFDPLHIVVDDRIVEGEQRWQALGSVPRPGGVLLLLVVAHTFREEKEVDGIVEVVRIISARAATREEQRTYED